MEELKHKISRLKTLGLLLLSYTAIPILFLSTNPDRLPLPLLLLPFILLFVSVLATTLFVGRRTRLLRGLTRRREYAVALMIAALPVLLAVFQSLHQLSVRDVIIAIGLIAAVSFYISRADFLR